MTDNERQAIRNLIKRLRSIGTEEANHSLKWRDPLSKEKAHGMSIAYRDSAERLAKLLRRLWEEGGNDE